MNQEELRRIVVWQYALVFLSALAAVLIAGKTAGVSALAGGLCVAVPNSLLALNLIIGLMLRRPIRPVVVIVGEFLKILVTCILFVLVAKFFSDLNWPAMIAGIVSAVCGQFALIFIKH